MTIRLVFPDPLEWQSGLEWGVEAAAILVREGHDVRCVFRSTGPMFEAVAFAAFDLGILDRCTFDDTAIGAPLSDDILVCSAVARMGTRTEERTGCLPIAPRNPRLLADALVAIARGGS